MHNIIQVIREKDNIYLFFDYDDKYDSIKNVESIIQGIYLDESYKIKLGYEIPVIYKYFFLGKSYNCISLWYDGEEKELDEAYNSFKKLEDLYWSNKKAHEDCILQGKI